MNRPGILRSPAVAMAGAGPRMAQRESPRGASAKRGVGFWTGAKTFLLGVTVMGAASKLGRFVYGDLLIPLSLAYVLVLFPTVFTRLALLPGRVVLAFSTFFVWTFFSAAQSDGFLIELIKLGVFAFTIVVVALLIRSREQVIAGVWGMAIPAAAISIISVASGLDESSLDVALDALGNRNALSLFTLPALLLGAWLAFDQNTTRLTRWVMASSSIVIAVVLFARSNRSGWLGVGIVVLMILARRASLTRYIKLVVVAAVAATVLQTVFTTEVFKGRVDQMVEGHTADKLRGNLILEGFKIAVENPVLGVGPQVLPYELAKRFAWHNEFLESHNLLAGVAGGSGLVGLAFLLWTGLELWRWKRSGLSERANEAAWLIQALIVLWVIRGQFTRDVLYSPSFAVAFGLAVGLGIVTPSLMRRTKLA